MKDLNAPIHLKGRDNLTQALNIAIKEGKNIQVTKTIYYPIAKKEKVSQGAIERSLNYLIGQLWNTNDLTEYGFNMNNKQPTTKNFILTLAEYLQNKNNKKPEE